MNNLQLPNLKFLFFFLLSLVIVSLGQPAWVSALGTVAALCGFALFWRAMLSLSHKKHRFWLAFLWFSLVQMFQLSWFLSHPFYYIYAVWLLLSFGMGLQFALLSLMFNEQKLTRLPHLFQIAAVWALMEWSRLFFLSGSSWNPVGLALAGNLFSLQAASVAGVFGLSFLVIVINLLALKVWLDGFNFRSLCQFALAALFPFAFGFGSYHYHDKLGKEISKTKKSTYQVLLVQTAFPVEETLSFKSRNEYVQYVLGEWRRILEIMKEHQEKSVDMIAIPELVVPFGTYSLIYPFGEVAAMFEEILGKKELEKLPPLELPYAYQMSGEEGKPWMVSNAFFVQSLADIFNAGVVIGLEDAEDIEGTREYYSSAIYIKPTSRREEAELPAQRYAKRVLVPMGEYIPFSFCRDLAAKYGVFGSFTCGKGPGVWRCGEASFGLSICYEEMFGGLMRENRVLGADFLLNLTSDAWFPNSKLIRQHLEHSRLRTVENGFPLARACNTGITCVIDSLGRDVAIFGQNDQEREHLAGALYSSVPLYNYQTLYSRFGDELIVGLSLGLLLFFKRRN